MALSLEQLLPVLAGLNANRTAAVSLAEIAGALELSPWYVQRNFARVVGESPKQYRLRLKLECAAVLLLGSEDSVLDIALAVGFDSHEGFTRAFQRRFKITPSDYRASRDTIKSERHGQLVSHVGPCIHLFRAPLERPIERNSMTYDITRQKIDETPILFIKRRIEHDRIAEALGDALPKVFGYAIEAGLPMAGQPFTRYLEWTPGFVTIEAGIPLAVAADAPEDRDAIEAGVLPGGDAAVTIHAGSYDKLGDAHAAVERWITDNELTGGGRPWEIYLTDPGEHPDPADWKTQIIWPLA